jgi:hypothetical protein
MLESCATDPLVHHGRHFGRTVHALCSIRTLLSNGKVRMREFADVLEEDFTHEFVDFCLLTICCNYDFLGNS